MTSASDMKTPTFVRPTILLHAEAFCLLCASCIAFNSVIPHHWGLFASLFFVPDLSLLLFMGGSKIVASILYNLVHNYVPPFVLVGVALVHPNTYLAAISLIWIAHISFDRMLGYGLKYPHSFKFTHLQSAGHHDMAIATRWKMAISEIERVLAIFAGISAGDVVRATQYIDRDRFLQHNPYAADGVAGLEQFIAQASPEQLHIAVMRAFQDGPYVVTQATGKRSGKELFFDVFRFEQGLVVEHWAFSAPDAPSNASGHTQIDGPTKATRLEETEENRRLLRNYYETFHLHGDHSNIEQYFAGDLMIRHEPGVHDGISNFLRDVEELMKHRTIDDIELLIVQGDFGFIAAKGTHEHSPCVYIDLYRLQEGKIVEHWGFPELIPPEDQWKNRNGML